jgi:hypothetical protein
MSVSSVQSSQNVYTDHLFEKTTNQSNVSQSGSTTEPYTLSISDEANKLSRKSQVNNNAIAGQAEDSNRMSYADLPVEAFFLPKWSNKWFPDLAVIEAKIGERYIDSKQYQYDSLSSKRKDELHEYTSTLHKYINEELKNHGIRDRVDYYTKFMQDDELSEEVHQAVTNRLAENPRLMGLMESFDISLY